MASIKKITFGISKDPASDTVWGNRKKVHVIGLTDNDDIIRITTTVGPNGLVPIAVKDNDLSPLPETTDSSNEYFILESIYEMFKSQLPPIEKYNITVAM